jgi:hypothetical protein
METLEEKTPVKTWEYKDRNYYLKGSKEPITFKLGSRHTTRHPLLWFDDEKGYNRELRYATNQQSVFADEQKGPATLAHIIFENGSLSVPKENVQLQKLLSLYHPAKGQIYEEFDAVVQAADQYDSIELELAALNTAYEMEIEQAEAILRVELGSNVSNMSSKEIKRDVLMFAKKSPGAFLDLAEDENVELRNFGIKACELNILKLAQDQRTFQWASNGRKLFTIPFDENPYSALAAWFKTDEGVDVYQAIEKKLK